ncbi:MAG: hypothetical protein Q7K98_00170 [Candidatus Omnitrophota bacterium]|nr:hypothetical protein [Candidatus Omnitrophota bacterium]
MNVKSIIFLIFAFMIISPALADDSDDKTISGTVTSLDWVKSTLAVRYADPYTGNTDEITLKITGDSELTRGSDSISASDIEQGDPLMVTYYRDDASGLKIRRLTDLNDANR